MALWLWLACANDPAGSAEPTPWIFEATPESSESRSLAEVEAAVQDAVDRVRSVQAAPLLDIYAGLLATADEACPGRYASGEGSYWSNTCTSSDGTDWLGFAFTADQVYASEEGTQEGRTLYAGGTITTPESWRFEASGTAAIQSTFTPALAQHVSVVRGSFSWDGPSADGTWLADGLAPDLTTVGYTVVTPAGRGLLLDGGLAGLPGGAVAFDGLTALTPSLGGCAEEPGGSLAVRNPDGSWTDVVFDGPLEAGGPDSGPCDGCGVAWHRGEKIGKVCADFSTLLAWEERPW